LAGGELDQIQFLLGHVSIQTPGATSDASRSSATQSMTEWASSRKQIPDEVQRRIGRPFATRPFSTRAAVLTVGLHVNQTQLLA